MRTKSFIFVLSAVSVVFSMCLSLGLGSQEEMSLERKTAVSDLIVIGRVIGVKTAWDETKSLIYTYVSLSIEENIKGSSPKKDVTLKIPGGIIEGELGAWVPGMPTFQKGERAILFLLCDLRSDHFFVVNGVHGKYLITEENTVASEEVSLPAFVKEIRRNILRNK